MRVPFNDGSTLARLHRATLSVHPLLGAAMWATVVWVVVFGRLGDFSLLDPDEAHYAQLTREMLRTHRWLVPLRDGAPYIDKPVLFHWLQAAAARLIGESELALRLPSACAAVSLCLVVRWAGSQLFGPRVGTRAAVMFATLPLTFVLASVGLFDMVFSAFLFSAIACLLVAALRDRPALEYAAWPLLTLAVMTKGPVALVLVALFGLALSASKTTRVVVTRLQWVAGVVFVVVVASPWFVYMWLTFRDHFVRDYVWAGNVWYFTAPLAFTTRRSDPTFYLRTFTGAFFPWGVIAIGRGVDVCQLWRRGTWLSVEERVLWTWTLVVLVFFTVARFKLDTYIFPAAPAIAMLAAVGWQHATAADGHTQSSWTRRAVVTVALVLVVAGLLASVVLFRINLGLTTSALMLPAALCVGGALLMLRLRHHPGALPRSPAETVATLVAVYVSVVLVGLPVLERSRPTAPIGRWIHQHSPPESPVGVVGLPRWHASLRYYADRRLITLSDPDAIRRFFDEHASAYVLMLRRDYQAFRAEGSNIRAVGGRDAIVGSEGKYIRRQRWGRIVVVMRADAAAPEWASADADIGLNQK